MLHSQADEALVKAGNDATRDPGLDVEDDDGIIVCYNASTLNDDDDKIEALPLPPLIDRKRGRAEVEESSNKR